MKDTQDKDPAQVERARRLRQQIDSLARGETPEPEHPSLREQIEKRKAEIEEGDVSKQ